MNKAKKAIERQRKYAQEYYDRNAELLRAKQFNYRYEKSVQKVIDDNWNTLTKLNKADQRSWAVANGFDSSDRKMIVFWKAIGRNSSEGSSAVAARRNEMKLFQKNKKLKK
jgi:hypothetical protein